MNMRRLQRSARCFFKYGPFRCPHVERHSRRRTSPAHHQRQAQHQAHRRASG